MSIAEIERKQRAYLIETKPNRLCRNDLFQHQQRLLWIGAVSIWPAFDPLEEAGGLVEEDAGIVWARALRQFSYIHFETRKRNRELCETLGSFLNR